MIEAIRTTGATRYIRAPSFRSKRAAYALPDPVFSALAQPCVGFKSAARHQLPAPSVGASPSGGLHTSLIYNRFRGRTVDADARGSRGLGAPTLDNGCCGSRRQGG